MGITREGLKNFHVMKCHNKSVVAYSDLLCLLNIFKELVINLLILNMYLMIEPASVDAFSNDYTKVEEVIIQLGESRNPKAVAPFALYRFSRST